MKGKITYIVLKAGEFDEAVIASLTTVGRNCGRDRREPSGRRADRTGDDKEWRPEYTTVNEPLFKYKKEDEIFWI